MSPPPNGNAHNGFPSPSGLSVVGRRSFSYFSKPMAANSGDGGRPTSPPRAAMDLNRLYPHGKRPMGIGTEAAEQKIVSAFRGDDCVVLRATILCAGFVLGPHGACVHQIEHVTGAQIHSFNR